MQNNCEEKLLSKMSGRQIRNGVPHRHAGLARSSLSQTGSWGHVLAFAASDMVDQAMNLMSAPTARSGVLNASFVIRLTSIRRPIGHVPYISSSHAMWNCSRARHDTNAVRTHGRRLAVKCGGLLFCHRVNSPIRYRAQ